MQRVERADGAVGEAVDDFQRELLSVEAAEDAAAAFGAEIEGEEFLGIRHVLILAVFLPSLRTQRSGVSGCRHRLLRCAVLRGSERMTNPVRLLRLPSRNRLARRPAIA